MAKPKSRSKAKSKSKAKKSQSSTRQSSKNKKSNRKKSSKVSKSKLSNENREKPVNKKNSRQPKNSQRVNKSIPVIEEVCVKSEQSKVDDEQPETEIVVKQEVTIDDYQDEDIVKQENCQDIKIENFCSTVKDEVMDTEPRSLNDEQLNIDLDITVDYNEQDLLAKEIMKMKCFPDLQKLMYGQSIEEITSNSVGKSVEDGNNIFRSMITGYNSDEVKTLEVEEIINCTCGYKEEDGLMIQCDVCMTWQHAVCTGIFSHTQIPNNYRCIYCVEPHGITYSHRYSYAKYLLTMGKLSKFSMRTYDPTKLAKRRFILTETFRLAAQLRSIYTMDRTLRTKLDIAKQPDHPKLYMWSTNWDDNTTMLQQQTQDGPVGEKPIESFDCRLQLLDKIEGDQRDLSHRLSIISDELQRLEPDYFLKRMEEKNMTRVLYQVSKDLNTISTAVNIS